MKLFKIADQYCKESNWLTLTALKFCLLSLGLIVGVLLPDSWKVPVIIICVVVFLITYIPLMLKFFRIWKEYDRIPKGRNLK